MATRTAPPPLTTILLVRHGQTPSTGKILPGRAPGLHLADAGRGSRPQRAAERIGELKQVDALYTSPLERARETAAPIAKVTGQRATRRAGPARVRLRRVDRRRAAEADEEAGVADRAAGAVDVPLPRRRELLGDAAPHRVDARPAARRPPRRHDRVRLPRRPDQGRRRPRPRHPPRPVPAHRHQHVRDQRHRLVGAAARPCWR